MSAFWIFATCLTVAYIIYYSVVVWRDLSKPKEQVSSSEETFELVDTASPEPTRVVEQTDKVFRAEGGTPVRPKEKEHTNSPAAPAPMKPESPDPDPGPQLDATGAPTTPMEKKVAAAKEEMVPIDVIGSTELVQDQLEAAMTGELDTVDIEKTVTTPERSSGALTRPSFSCPFAKGIEHRFGRTIAKSIDASANKHTQGLGKNTLRQCCPECPFQPALFLHVKSSSETRACIYP